MAIDAIEKWLKAPEMKSGISLFKKYGSNSAKALFYESGVYKLPQLIKDLKAIASTPPQRLSTPVQSVSAPPSAFKRTDKKLPVHVLEIKKAGDKAWKEARNLHATILQQRSRKRRHEMAKRILELVPFAFEQWRNVDEYERTGSLSFLLENKPQERTVGTMSLIELVAATKNIPGYITKFKNQLPKATTKEKTDYLKRMIAEKEAEYAAVNERIAFLNQKIIELCL